MLMVLASNLIPFIITEEVDNKLMQQNLFMQIYKKFIQGML